MIESAQRKQVAEVWSDFDGTIIESIPTNNIGNWMKRPMGGIKDYRHFLDGIRFSDVSVEGIISRRPSTLPWRLLTDFSMAGQRLEGFFNDPTVHLLAAEHAKAEWLVERSRERVVGVVEDRPHRLGASILKSLVSVPKDVEWHPIVIGAVPHYWTDTFFCKFLESTEHLAGAGYDIQTTISTFRAVESRKAAISVEAENFRLDVVPLPKYSERAGIVFGKYLRDMAEQ